MIVIDSREKKLIEKVKRKGKKSNIDVEVRTLDAGDFLIMLDDGSKYLFERKTLNDFQNSVMSKRLWNQLYKLQNKLTNGDVDKVGLAITNFYFNKHTRPSVIYGALGSIYRRFNMDVLFFRSNAQFLDFIFKVCSKPKSRIDVKPEYLLQPLIGSLENIEYIDIVVKVPKKSRRKERTIETKRFPINIRYIKG